jgi:putative glutamine amidotransferase
VRPLIAISTSLATDGRERAQLNASYIAAIESAGGVPLLLPPQLSPGSLRQLLASAQALVLTGGGDVNPELYGEQRDPSLRGLSDERDTSERALIGIAAGRGLPTLAICRGAQLLNVFLGGSLIQDIPTMVEGAVEHSGGETRHLVKVEPDSLLHRLTGTKELTVNSRHHQALARLGDGLRAVAWSPDGLVEAIEGPGPWLLGVQWHPEDLAPETAAQRSLFEGLVGVARV